MSNGAPSGTPAAAASAAAAAPMSSASNGGASMSAGGGRPILSPQYLMAHRVGVPGQKDVIWNPLFDFLAYPATGPVGNVLSFFATQQGQGSSSAPGVGAGVPKTVFDTNLQVPNQLTLGNEFYAIGSETLFFPGVQPVAATPFAVLPGVKAAGATVPAGMVNDTWALGNQGFKSLKIGTDRYYIQDGPLSLFPPCTGLTGFSGVALYDTAAATSLEVNYARWGGEPYTIVPVYIQTNQLFTMTYTFATTIATPSGNAGRIGERLRGYLIRQAT
jgi:hypothetical protein